MIKTRTLVGVLLISLYYISLFSSCAMPTISRFSVESGEIEEIFRTTSTISLAWNYDNPSNVQSYKMYYRSHGSSDWVLLDTISSSAPVFEVSHSSVGDGSWDFGVTAVDLGDNESDIHSSLDQDAVPTTGWYLLWIE